MIKINTPPKALAMKINLFFLAFFVVLYSILFLCPFASVYNDHAASLVKCSLSGCQHKVRWKNGIKMKSSLVEPNNPNNRRELIKREKPNFLNTIGKEMKIGMINMETEDVSEWESVGEMRHISFEHVSKSLEWKHLFPEWIDEEEEVDGPSCPDIPMPNLDEYENMDMIVANLPCEGAEEKWNRDVFRLQVHLVAANVAARKGNGNPKMKVVFLSKCTPMVEIFGCDELVRREGDWWYYGLAMNKLKQKVALPVGSCDLAMPLWGKGTNEAYNVWKTQGLSSIKSAPTREAYATVLHSSENYVCGAIALAQSLLRTGTQRDLLLLLDTSIPQSKRVALSRAGWKLRLIERIRNPRAQKNTYNEYNYSKFRLWQLTDYDKIIFIDSDVIVLRSLDVLFTFPQMSATGNDGSIFNSGIMVIEPSNCTFGMLMHRRKEIVSYNGGDQGFLNEVFAWWHRLPRRVNYLKNFWSNSSAEAAVKNQMFGSDPPGVYSIHFLGLKPWACYRDYDCNWDVPAQRVYASDVAHARWWRVYDAMDGSLKGFCGLSKKRKVELEMERENARKLGLEYQHWRINVTDPRIFF
ncbi:UDP-glucuronate:xylan alpha-glucuronosyltransferase 2 [Phtheirospermum japonicum]|uniref:Hexosyltransferase n=1 Tax=Phtheirospermum japonicum TaxID=374723 RepID=A0A830CAH1_9LAMI|nr:UDP-glucuronate:xylan alpha-glucuronosyltransferase 2 [Phtheirospermum japonicum]